MTTDLSDAAPPALPSDVPSPVPDAASLPPVNPVVPPAPLILVDHLRVRFAKLMAVDNVSLSLHAGHLLGLIGPNGAGKTTLLRAVAGLQPISSGRVVLMGQPLHPDDPELLQHVGFTPDTPPVYEELTVRTFLRFIAKGYNISPHAADERIDFWLEKVWLSEKANTKIRGLSRGMRQRVGIARTLIANPNIILLDEPAGGLDPGGRVQFRQLLCSLRDMGKALIVSSHILSDLSDYCTHIGMMSHGRLVQFGTVRQISAGIESHRARYTLLLAEPVPRYDALLRQFFSSTPEVTEAQLETDRVYFEYHSDRLAAAEMLKMLMKLDIPISSFTAAGPDLEQAYLRANIGQVD